MGSVLNGEVFSSAEGGFDSEKLPKERANEGC